MSTFNLVGSRQKINPLRFRALVKLKATGEIVWHSDNIPERRQVFRALAAFMSIVESDDYQFWMVIPGKDRNIQVPAHLLDRWK